VQVHRQTAASVVQHMGLGVAGLGCEDALTHLLNYVWPNIFETSPHVVNAVQGAVDGCRLALGPAIVLNYQLQVLTFYEAQSYPHMWNAELEYGLHGLEPSASWSLTSCRRLAHSPQTCNARPAAMEAVM